MYGSVYKSHFCLCILLLFRLIKGALVKKCRTTLDAGKQSIIGVLRWDRLLLQVGWIKLCNPRLR